MSNNSNYWSSNPKPPGTDVKSFNHEQLKKFFKLHDADEDGYLSKQEITKAFKDLGAFLPSYRATRGISHADANRNGLISLDELDDLVKYARKHGFKLY